MKRKSQIEGLSLFELIHMWYFESGRGGWKINKSTIIIRMNNVIEVIPGKLPSITRSPTGSFLIVPPPTKLSYPPTDRSAISHHWCNRDGMPVVETDLDCKCWFRFDSNSNSISFTAFATLHNHPEKGGGWRTNERTGSSPESGRILLNCVWVLGMQRNERCQFLASRRRRGRGRVRGTL